MSFEVIKNVKRTIYVAKCPQCQDTVTVMENPPRERLCSHCSQWVKYEEQSYTGPDLK